MNFPAHILAVDDTPTNLKLLTDLLTIKGYTVETASSGEEGLEKIARKCPDLVLLDVIMSGMSGFDVCRAIRSNSVTAMLPIVLVTSLDAAQERISGIEAGADDFLTKPINSAELLARVKSLLRIKSLHDDVQRQRLELADWSLTLEQRVADALAQVESMGRLRRFFSPSVADLILSGSMDDPLHSHRAEITAVFLDLRGFTAFTERGDPEDVFDTLREYHAEMGRIIVAHEATLEHFAGDGMMIFFNDPVPVSNPSERAVRMAIEMHRCFVHLSATWEKRGHQIGMGIGIAQGYATLGVTGFEGRRDYAAIGSVTNLAARLCDEASSGQILISAQVLADIKSFVEATPIGEIPLKGFSQPVRAFNVLGLRAQ